jgi:hypothetical protein
MDPIEQLKDAQDIRFDSGASLRIRERLMAHMREHPMRIPSPYHRFSMHSPFLSHLRMPAIALVLIIGVGSATTFAAADALPGDTLYPVKVGVIEPARVLFAATPTDKAAVNVSIALTRVHEAEQLALKDRLTDAQGAEVETDFDTSLSNAKATLAVLSEKDPVAAASLESSLDISLDAHEAVLDTLSSVAATTSAKGAKTLAFHVRERSGGHAEAARAKQGAAVEAGPIRAAVMLMSVQAPEPAATATASSTVQEDDHAGDSASDERSRAVQIEKDSILHSLGL